MAMCLSSPDDNLTLKIQMLDINMTARRFLPISSIALQHEKRFLSGGGFILPFTCTSIRHRTLHSGILSTTIPAIFSGDLPYHFLVGIQSNEQLSLLSHNPYIFKPHGLKKYSISKNGVNIPQDGVPIGGSDGSFLRSYTRFVEHTGGRIFESAHDITPDEFIEKSFFISYDLTPCLCMGSHGHQSETGVIDLNLTFENPTSYPLTLVILGCFESVVTISKDDVVMNYTT